MDQLAFTDTPATRCAYYQQTCGLPAKIHPEIGRIAIRAGHVGAITMPTPLGHRIRADRENRQIPLGPIIAHVRSRRWTFLVVPDLPGDVDLFAELLRLNVSIVPIGGQIALPSPDAARAAYRQWVVPPRDPFRPTDTSIVDAVRSCARLR